MVGTPKVVCVKLYGPKWLLVERDQMASLIDGLSPTVLRMRNLVTNDELLIV